MWKGSWRWGGIVANEQRLHFRVIFCFLQSKGVSPALLQIFGDNACHPEPIRFAQGKLHEGSGSTGAEILRCAQSLP